VEAKELPPFHKHQPQAPVLSQMKPVDVLKFCFFNIYFNTVYHR